ncbi:proline--tRNA ligase [Rhizocola hellebori]|uniref:Proline--tRNA ligase n=1 Tax=Rhizocola hellebori TaxID=1392758 RepID=A0A8J3QIS9_9ACTN|nr:proline--tRNA ligase [Rhizocola hellebori]GIH10193.1 proline--tRNA ligase [Rhizocola hellebori]
MRWSQLHIPTLRQDPAGADAVSHRLLLRGGYIRQLMAGHYCLLPLAIRVRAKIIDIIREEMAAAGAQEFLLPTMQPAELWRKSGRWDLIGAEMFRLRDRKDADIALGMTHEEIFTDLAQELRSYRELPQTWYQIQTKFRDEPRVKSGLMRVREFTMKDAYSFDLDAAGLDTSFQRQHDAYHRIFARLGIPAIAVQASSGIMGGSDSVEFMCPTDAGEDIVVHCDCGYAANVEKATSRLEPTQDSEAELAEFDTPDARTIEELARLHGKPAQRQIKTLVYVADDQPVLVLMRGDHALVEQKLIDTLGAADLRPALPGEIVELLGASPGSLGAVGVKHLPVIADEALRGRKDMSTGANRDGVHYSGVDVCRDILIGQWADLREVLAGEPCSLCGQPLRTTKTVEIGHIFKLGTRYTETLGVTVLGPDGERVKPIMGCYGIGVERALAAVVESHHDDAGIVWPLAIAPFHVAIAQLGDAPEVAEAAGALYQALLAQRIEVILDDRSERPGVKFSDIELVGIPFRITVSARGIAAGTVEVTTRATRSTDHLPIADAAAHLVALVNAA